MAVLKQALVFEATEDSLKLFDLIPGFAGCRQVRHGSSLEDPVAHLPGLRRSLREVSRFGAKEGVGWSYGFIE